MIRPALVELPADDPARARAFWGGLLGAPLRERVAAEGSGWQIGAAPVVGVHERGRGPGDTGSLAYFAARDLPGTLAEVVELGGSVVHPGARFAICRDPEGTPFGLSASDAPDPVALTARARALLALHVPGEPVVLAGAWDEASARAATDAGLRAVAVASHGAEDAFAAIARVCAAADGVPVSADLEAGHGLSAPALVERLLDAGAVGADLGDTDPSTGRLRPLAEQAAWLASVREAADRAGVPVVLNARTDVHRHEGATHAQGLERLAAYRAAGADCLCPAGCSDLGELAAYAALGPVDARAGLASRSQLAAAGVARISFGRDSQLTAMAALRHGLAGYAAG